MCNNQTSMQTPATVYCIIRDQLKREYGYEPKPSLINSIMGEIKSWYDLTDKEAKS